MSTTYKYYLERPSNNLSWRPSFVRNMTNFVNTIENYREKYHKAPKGSQKERNVVANFNRDYRAWLVKVKKQNSKRRANEAAFIRNLAAARKSGNAAAINAVYAKYNRGGSPSRQRSPARQRNSSVARSASPKRSGKKRNTGSLFKEMARRNLSRMKANLMAQKAALESERNKLETQISAITRKIWELPNR